MAGGSDFIFLFSMVKLSIKKGREAMRYAKIEPFMNIYIDPELFRFHDQSNSQNRYITLQEIAFVACRITTSHHRHPGRRTARSCVHPV